MEALKKQQDKKAEWRANGHGSYEEIAEEKEFFNVTRKSDNCVIQVSYPEITFVINDKSITLFNCCGFLNSFILNFQFYRQETERCKIFDKHLKILAHKHPETKFAKINAEKCPFLTDRLKIRVIPTLALIKVCKYLTRGIVYNITR